MIFRHIFDISKAYQQKDNIFLHKNQSHLNKYQYISGFKNFFTLVAVTPDQDLEGCHRCHRVNKGAGAAENLMVSRHFILDKV